MIWSVFWEKFFFAQNWLKMILAWRKCVFEILARGPLGRLEVLWSKSSSVRASVRASVRMMSQTCNRQNLRTVIGMDLLFFLMGWYKQGVVQWQTKLGLRMGKALICNSFLHYLLCNICILGNIWTWKGNENQTNIIFTYLDTCHSFSTFSKKSTFPKNLHFQEI